MRPVLSRGLLAVFLFVGLAGSAAAAKAADIVKDFLAQDSEYKTYSEQVMPWHKALVAALKQKPDEDAAARILAPEFGLTQDQTRELERVWIRFVSAYWNNENEDETKIVRASIDRDIIALASETDHNPFVLSVATEAITRIGRCDSATFDALMKGERDVAQKGWPVALQSHCSNWLGAYAEMAPQKAGAALVALTLRVSDKKAAGLALSELAASEALLARASPKDRAALRQRFSFLHLKALMNAGLVDEGIAFYEAIPARDRQALLAQDLQGIDVTVDGLPLSLPVKDSVYVYFSNTRDELSLYLAAAYYLKGKLDRARAIVRPDLLMLGHDALDCWHKQEFEQGGRRKSCAGNGEQYFEAEFLDLALVHISDDPYDLFEMNFAAAFDNAAPVKWSGLWVDAMCKYLEGDTDAMPCSALRKHVGENLGEDYTADEDQRTLDNIRAVVTAALPHAVGRIDAYKTKFAAAIARYPVEVAGPRVADEGPLPSRFKELPLPPQYAGPPEKEKELPDWIKAMTPLPDGYQPVRVGRDKNRVAVISVSQNFDPTGEVTAGGYWVHLSEDDGKTWRRPLYTGLADHFPYVVLSASNLPLFDGDTLEVAVDVQELDLSSITYPPIGLRTRREKTGLYLRIPIAELLRDSDGDGIPDIAEEHLLLDPNNADSDGDGIPDGIDPLPNVKQAKQAAPEQQALAAFLERFFSIHTGAIIQPVDAPNDETRLRTAAMGSAPESASADRPIFVSGNPPDFAGLHPDRMMLVYNDADLARLRRLTPDFHAISLSPIIFNRMHDRGYMTWSAGWAGGTVRIYRSESGWKIQDISHWIT